MRLRGWPRLRLRGWSRLRLRRRPFHRSWLLRLSRADLRLLLRPGLDGSRLRLLRANLRLGLYWLGLNRANLRLFRSRLLRLNRPGLGLNRTHLRLAWSGAGIYGSRFRLTGTNLGLPRPSRLYLGTVVRFAGPVLWLSRSRGLAGPSVGLTRAVDFARTAAWVGTTNSGLCGDRPGSRDQSGAAFVHVVELLAVLGRRVLILDLCGHRRRSRAAEGCNFCGLRTSGNASTATVVGYAGIVVYDDGAVINMSHVDVDSIHRAVVVEVVSVPVAAVIAEAGVTEAIIDASVEADMGAPVSAAEAPTVVVPAPVTGSPKSSVIRWKTPSAGYPVVAGGRPVPVAGGPDVVGSGGYGLVVLGECRRRLVGVYGGLGFAFGVELIEGLRILIGLIGGLRRLCRLVGSGLLRILFGGLYRLSLGAGGKNSSLSGYGSRGWSRLRLSGVDRGQIGVGWILAIVVRNGCGIRIDSVAAGDAGESEDSERKA